MTPEYKTWESMKTRCGNPQTKRYADYGGRGIRVHPPWAQSRPIRPCGARGGKYDS